MRLPRVAGAAVALLAAALLPLPAAHAATYDVWSCKTPSGQPTSTAGWTSASSLSYDQPADDCAAGGRLSAKLSAYGGAVSGGLASQWRFDAPPGTTVRSAVLDRSMITRPQPGDHAAVAQVGIYRDAFVDDPAHRLQSCTSAMPACPSPSGRVRLKIGASMFGISAGCAGPSRQSLCLRGAGSRARIAIDSAKLTLDDPQAPRGEVSGPVLADGPVRGRSSLTLQATDVGAGVWQAEVRLGATTVFPRQTLPGARRSCDPLRGLNAFGSPTPCARSVRATLPVNTKGAKDGSDLLTVTIWDAAGNATVAIAKPVIVDNARRIQADGTILMPRVEASTSLDDQLLGGTTDGPSGASLSPVGLPGGGPLAPIVAAMTTLGEAQIGYCYGGGHASSPAVPSGGSYCWLGNPARKYSNSGAVGLDCSSSVSWVLQQAGYAIPTMTSSEFANFGDPGEGSALTIWANAGHVYLEVKSGGQSYFWGTSAANVQHGPGWHPPRSSAGFTPRHLPGL